MPPYPLLSQRVPSPLRGDRYDRQLICQDSVGSIRFDRCRRRSAAVGEVLVPRAVFYCCFVRHTSTQRVLSHEVGEVDRSYCCGTEGLPGK